MALETAEAAAAAGLGSLCCLSQGWPRVRSVARRTTVCLQADDGLNLQQQRQQRQLS